MIGALWTGVSGLASQQSALDNESNNIANVNTVGYKASRISFADQFYQDKIGKGSKVLDAEKLFTVATTKSTGVPYDMALKGDGFFIVADKRQGGSAQDTYTRAGNFRMGDNGTLQDSAGNEVQGWVMSNIDPDRDVFSTNPSTSVFTKEYKNVLASKIIKHASSVESIALKATDYENTAKADSIIFSGAGKKSIKAKTADVEEAQKSYNYWLDKLKNEPDGPSSSASAQVSEINFKSSKTDSVIRNKNDQIYVVINGERISQEFVVTTANLEFINDVYNNEPFTNFKTDYGLQTPPKDLLKANPPSAAQQKEIETYNMLAGRVETYKQLADKISEKPGMVAKTVSESGGKNEDVLENEDVFRESTKIQDVLKGIIQIESLIPGVEMKISDVGEVASGNSSSKGNILTSSFAKVGEGAGAVESARQALIKAITGKQEDVYTPSDLKFKDATGAPQTQTFQYSIDIYDKDLKKNLPVPNDNGNPVQVTPIEITDAASIDDFITKFNKAADKASPKLSNYIEAININDNLVIRTLDKNVDVEFSGTLKIKDANQNPPFIPMDTNSNHSGRSGAGAELIEIRTNVDQLSTRDSLQLRYDYLKISDSAFGSFEVDNTGLVTMDQDGIQIAVGQVAVARFANNRALEAIGDNLFAKTTDSGDPIVKANNDGVEGIKGKTLELSGADLSESLVNLMVFQRAFEANAKTITTSDQLLNTLINLKR